VSACVVAERRRAYIGAQREQTEPIMNEALLKELMELTPEERIQLVEDLWDSIPPQDAPPLTAAQKQEIDRRYEAMVRDPRRGSKWEDVEARLRAKYK
jgi:putative addiction module component (TIGR02574 family)